MKLLDISTKIHFPSLISIVITFEDSKFYTFFFAARLQIKLDLLVQRLFVLLRPFKDFFLLLSGDVIVMSLYFVLFLLQKLYGAHDSRFREL